MASSRRPEQPSVNTILMQLKAAGTARKRASAIRVGIPMDKAYGVSVGIIRAHARLLKGHHALAEPLWATGVHEARLLAIMLADPATMRRRDIERWLDDVVSWDLCDHICGNLVRHRTDAVQLVRRWASSRKLYVKRAAFALIAELAVHGKTIGDEQLAELAELAVAHAGDARLHVRKAASWALRSIGKRNAAGQDRALAAAAALLESTDPAKRWVGRDAMRELESLVTVGKRGRLVPKTSKTGHKRSPSLRGAKRRSNPV
jgi:3-methyladenine DNA glycosylase AlkD